MKAKDLMIGDWVLAEGKPLQVTNVSCLGGDIIRVMNPIMSYDIAYASNIIALSNGAKDINKIEPIPLTPEILKKNGYRNSVIVDDYYIAHGIHYNVDSKCIMFGYVYGSVLEVKCEYVHELPHTARLCEIEKEVVV